MAKCFSKKYGNKGRSFNHLQSEKVMSRCLSAPEATSLQYCFQNHLQYITILSLIQALDTKRPVARLAKGDLLDICHLLSIQQCSAFPASWGHGQSCATLLICA